MGLTEIRAEFRNFYPLRNSVKENPFKFKKMSQKIVPVNPKPFLEKLVGQSVVVKLKWGLEYRGFLDSKDDYMNFKLSETGEWGYDDADASGKRDLKMKGKVGEVLIRCNNVLYIRQADNMGQAPNEEGEMAD